MPKVVNYKEFAVRPTFEMNELIAKGEGQLVFTTTNENGRFTYAVEQFRWNKWMRIVEVKSQGAADINLYTVDIAKHVHSGQNLFRVTVYLPDANQDASLHWLSAKFKSTLNCPEWEQSHVKSDLTLPCETDYEVYNKFGDLIKTGHEKIIDVSGLMPDVYYLNYDNHTTEFIRMPGK